jgi:capsular polysaccharide biosynthesis protein
MKLPKAVFSVVQFEGMSFHEQAVWWSRQTVVIAAHGAALTNSVFLRPQSIVMEIFPSNYYICAFFQTLVQESGSIHLEWYKEPTKIEALQHYQRHSKTYAERMYWRSLDVRPNATDVARAIIDTFTRTSPSANVSERAAMPP